MEELCVDSIYKSFRGKQILTDVFLRCKEGEIVGLLGRNGVGKSTLLKIIFGAMHSDYKFVTANGRKINGLTDRIQLIHYLPQHTFLPDHVKIKRLAWLLCKDEGLDRIESIAFMKPLLDKKCGQLSGGEKRMVEIFAMIYSRADYVLMDEPFNGISPIIRNDIKSILIEQSANKGFIITDHDFRNILDIADRLILIHDGGTKEINNTSELKNWNYLPENDSF